MQDKIHAMQTNSADVGIIQCLLLSASYSRAQDRLLDPRRRALRNRWHRQRQTHQRVLGG